MAGIVLLAFCYVLSQFYRTFLAVLTPSLMADVGVETSDLARASGFWFLAFAMMQFVVGVSLDRFGPRRTASVLLSVGSLGALLFAFATRPWMTDAAMALIGIGCAPVLMAAMYIFAKNYKPSLFAVASSWLMAFGMAGNVISATPLAVAAEAFGWRAVMVGLAGVTLLCALALLFFVSDPERDRSGGSGFAGYLEVLRLRSLWPLVPIMAVNYMVVGGVRGLWAGPYLIDVYGADQITIGQVTLYFGLAMIGGSLLYGPLDTLFGTRKWVVVVGNSICVAGCVALAFWPAPGMGGTLAIFILLALTGSSFGVVITHCRAFMPPHLIGRGVTAMNFVSIGAVGLSQLATGRIVEAATDPADPTAAYAALFASYALVLGTAVLVYLFSRDVPPERASARVETADSNLAAEGGTKNP